MVATRAAIQAAASASETTADSLWRSVLSNNPASLIHLLQARGGSQAAAALRGPGALTLFHAAVMGRCVEAMLLLCTAGVPLDAVLEECEDSMLALKLFLIDRGIQLTPRQLNRVLRDGAGCTPLILAAR